MRVDCHENFRISCNGPDAEHGNDGKPDDHYRAEQFSDAAGSMALSPKKEKQDQAGQGQYHWFGLGGGHFQPFQGGKDGNDRSNKTISVQQGRTKKPAKNQPSAQSGAKVLVQQGQHGENPAFTLIIGFHDE